MAARAILLADEDTGPYSQGCVAARRAGIFSRDDRKPCPYPAGSPEHRRWWEGYADVVDGVLSQLLRQQRGSR